MLRPDLARWVRTPLLTGRLALLGTFAAVALPTLVRAVVNGTVTGCEFTPYLPFVLLTAILIGWLPASLVVLASVATLGGLFISSHGSSACFISGAAVFLGSSALIIGTVVLIRRAMVTMQKRGPDESAGGIVFSLEQEQVYASWYGQGTPLLLGSRHRVKSMMQDFLAQEELAKRLNGRHD
jgi:hypothetical protein